MADLVGKVIAGRYEIVEKIGTGGFANVYKAKQLRPEGFVAVKVLLPEHSNDPNIVEEFFGEAALYVAFRDAPNVATILECDHDEEHDVNYLVMTLLGETVEDLIEKAPLPTERCFQLAEDIGTALRVVHSKNLVHRDIKCSNIMTLPGAKRFVLTDFGIGLIQEAVEKTARTRDLNTSGTWSYASPEQIRARKKQDIGPQSDFYSFGVVLYRAATGEYPFEPLVPQVMLDHIEKDPPDPRVANPDVPAPLAELILRCMRKSPDDRFRADGELLDSIAAARKAWESGDEASKGSGGGKTLGTIAGVIALAAIAYFGFLRGGSQPVSLESDPAGAVYRLYEGSKARFASPIREGTTPVELEGIKPGEYSLDLEKEGHFPIEAAPITIADGTPLPLLVLEKAWTLETTSQPDAASVELTWIDGTRMTLPTGTTPWRFDELRGGSYEIRFSKPGFEPLVDSLAVGGRENASYHGNLVAGSTLTLWLFTDPPGASVSIDGNAVSQPTNCEIREIPGGHHQFQFELAGYISLDTTAELRLDVGVDTLFIPLTKDRPSTDVEDDFEPELVVQTAPPEREVTGLAPDPEPESRRQSTPPREEVSPPKPQRSSTEGLSTLAERFETVLESESIRDLRSMIGNFSKDNEKLWSGFFGAAEKIDAETSISNQKVDGDTASMSVKVWLDYEDNKGRKQNTSFHYIWTLARAGEGWTIVTSEAP